MKPQTIPLVCLLCLVFLLGSALPSTAMPLPGETHPPQAQNAALAFQRLFFHFSDDPDNHAWWQSRIVVDDNGGLHGAFFDTESIYYVYCPALCGNEKNWTLTAVAPVARNDSLTYPTVAVNSQGQPRMLWHNSDDFVYAQCNSQCASPSSWTKVTLTEEFPNAPYHDVRYFAIDDAGRPRFINPYYQGLTYHSCDTGCTTASNWKLVELELGGRWDPVQLAVTASGQPRVMGINQDDHLVYGQCNSNCQQAGSWSFATVFNNIGYRDIPTFSFKLDGQGRPRIAFYNYSASSSTMYYAWADQNFTTPSSWKVDSLDNLPPAGDRTLDLAIDSQGRPHVAFASDNYDLRYLRCLSQCNTLSSQWEIQDVETGAQMDAAFPVTDGHAWWIDGYASLALDSEDNPHISYYAHNVKYVSGGTSTRARAIRFATTGGSAVLKNKVYLPALRR